MEEIHTPGGGVLWAVWQAAGAGKHHNYPFVRRISRTGRHCGANGAAESVAGVYGKWVKLSPADQRILLMAGISAGFGAVFGTPVAGAVFALEVLAVGLVRYNALLPCLMAGILADLTTTAWGIHHTHYSVMSILPTGSIPWLHINLLLLIKTILAGALFGLASYMFSESNT